MIYIFIMHHINIHPWCSVTRTPSATTKCFVFIVDSTPVDTPASDLIGMASCRAVASRPKLTILDLRLWYRDPKSLVYCCFWQLQLQSVDCRSKRGAERQPIDRDLRRGGKMRTKKYDADGAWLKCVTLSSRVCAGGLRRGRVFVSWV